MNGIVAATHCDGSIAAPAGVMGIDYALRRQRDPALAFRLEYRAWVAVCALRAHRAVGRPRVLDVGAAEGATLARMAHALGEGVFLGVEYDAALAEAWRERPPNVQIMQGDAEALPADLAASSFDMVCMLALLEHLSDPAAALREARRVLARGGLVVATCPNPRWDALAGRLGLIKGDHHVQAFDLRRLRSLVEEAGFDVVESRPFMWAPVALLPYARVPVPVRMAAGVDAVAARVPLLRRLCVNGYIIGRKTS